MYKKIAVACLALCAVTVQAQVEVDTSLVVSTIERPPFVVLEGESFTGFSIELWDEIARRNDWTYQYVVQPTFVDMLKSVQEPHTSDLAISNISVTSERKQIMDFSSSIFDGGLQVVVYEAPEQASPWDMYQRYILLGGLLVVVLCGYLGYALGKKKFVGVDEADTESNLINADTMGMTSGARIVSGMIIGTVCAVLFTTVALQVVSVDDDVLVAHYTDLNNKEVGVSRGSTAESFMKDQGIPTIAYDSIVGMLEDVSSGEIDAVVHDAPVIDEYMTVHKSHPIRIAGSLFNQESYGIALPLQSKLTEQVNETLFQMKDDGTYSALYKKWFIDTKK